MWNLERIMLIPAAAVYVTTARIVQNVGMIVLEKWSFPASSVMNVFIITGAE